MGTELMVTSVETQKYFKRHKKLHNDSYLREKLYLHHYSKTHWSVNWAMHEVNHIANVKEYITGFLKNVTYYSVSSSNNIKLINDFRFLLEIFYVILHRRCHNIYLNSDFKKCCLGTDNALYNSYFVYYVFIYIVFSV